MIGTIKTEGCVRITRGSNDTLKKKKQRSPSGSELPTLISSLEEVMTKLCSLTVPLSRQHASEAMISTNVIFNINYPQFKRIQTFLYCILAVTLLIGIII